MTNETQTGKTRYVELGNYIVDVKDVDVLVFENVNDISPLFPLKPMTALVAICDKGSQQLTADDKEIEFTEGNILISPPNLSVIGGEHSSDFKCNILCISDHLVRGLLRDKVEIFHHSVFVNQVTITNLTPVVKEEYCHYLSLVNSKLKHNNMSFPYEILLVLLRALLLELGYMMESSDIVVHEQKMSQGKLLFNRFLSLITNSQVKRLPITAYASQLAITPKYLKMLCLKYSNKTASDWVIEYTLEEIRYYLRNSDKSIKEISALLGFSNMSHFGSYVRKHLGVSPSEYRFNKEIPA